MDKKRIFSTIRFIFVIASIFCLVAAVLMTFREYWKESRPVTISETPVEVSHRVLFINSNGPLYYSYEEKTNGLKQALYPNGIEYDVVFMDVIGSDEEENRRVFHDFLAARLSTYNDYDGIIVVDDDALRFALQYQEELFRELPVVFFGINDLELAESAQSNPYMTGFWEPSYLEATVDLALRLKPDTSEVVGIHDDTSAGLVDGRLFEECAERHPEYAFSTLDTSELSEQELEKSIKELPSDAILLFMTCYSDKDGNIYSMETRTKSIISHARVPVFRNYPGGVGRGVLGGTFIDFYEQGRQAGEVMASILDGSRRSDLKLQTEAESRTVFDYQLLKNNGMNRSLLPENTEFVNRNQTFLEKYGRVLPAAVLIVMALVFLLLGTNTNMAIAKITNHELEESKEDLEDTRKTLQYRADYDTMLGLLNRRAITEQLQRELTEESVYSILMIDMDDFKGVNECYGHEFADEILISLAGSLLMMGDENGWVISRYGGDQFLIMIPDVQLTEKDDTIQMLLQLFRAPIAVGEELIIMSASIGISHSDGVTSPDQNIINAEVAMYEAKERGRNTAFVYADEMKRRVREENQIKAKLLSAFENDGFYMVYQPQINSNTLEVSGFEALVRMKEPGLYPGQFIPVVEQSGWIARLGRVTTELAIRQLALWRDENYPLHPVSVNFSSNQMNDTGYYDFVKDLLANYEIEPKYLELEFTEGLYIERTKQAEELFGKFKELGLTLLMDDFGTGYSSLGYLTYIPVDIIKLDKSLVDAYLQPGKDAFIHDVINMIHDLGKKVIIEGVEEEWQFKRLREFEADAIQGYYFSKPITPEEAIVFQISKQEQSSD